MQCSLTPIGIIHSCYKEKFGIPRQPGLAPAARATLELLPPYNRAEAVVGLEAYSHLWVQFVFHHCLRAQWKPTVRPPRLGGNRRLGVFATRSTFRPNPIGLSVVKLEQVACEGDQVRLELSGIDLLDGTPVLDIKPYIPYADSLPEAQAAIAPEPPRQLPVRFSPETADQCRSYQAERGIDLQELIEQVLSQDPRPAYRQAVDPERRYGMHLLDLNVQWVYWQETATEKQVIEVIGIERLAES